MAVPVAYAVPAPAPSAPGFGGTAGTSLANDWHTAATDAAATALLREAGFPPGLTNILLESRAHFGMRHWVVDNSGSMSIGDGQRLVSAGAKSKMISCSRWEELRESISLCGEFASASRLPTEFRLINAPAGAPRSVTVGATADDGHADDSRRHELAALASLVGSEPGGGTPLCESVSIARAMIESCASELRARGQKAVLVVACDGKPSDGNLAAVMATLKPLPVWVVVRLCTDEDDVVEFWNNIDEQLELDMDVLDDVSGEAKEVCGLNPWIVYGRPLHTAREFGVRHKCFDLLDERAFSVSEMAKFCELVYDVKLPHPDVDWGAFESALGVAIREGPTTWNPLTGKVEPWISVKILKAHYGKGGGCTVL